MMNISFTQRIAIILGVIVIIVLASIYANKKIGTPDGKLYVVASFYPLGHFAEQVGGSTVDVNIITPPGTEAHDFEPTPSDIIAVQRANVFIYNGGGFDPWAEKLAENLRGENIVLVNMTEHFKTAEDAPTNPHRWTDPLSAIDEVNVIRDALLKAEPSMKEVYDVNTKVYTDKLFALHWEYEAGLASCALRDAIISHDSFSYLAARYNIHMIPIAGISPEEEPSAKKLSEIVDIALAKKIPVIFFETVVSPKLSETIARETGAETMVLDPVETLTNEQLKSGEDYISVMKKNLNNLRKALSCV